MTEEKRKPKCPVRDGRVLRTRQQRASRLWSASLPGRRWTRPDAGKWVSGSTDAGRRRRSGSQIQAFLREHRVEKVIATDHIIGCPHEEGADYPIGAKYPFCPFWRDRNRFTHEEEE